jgi:hypothetical protein
MITDAATVGGLPALAVIPFVVSRTRRADA